MAEGITTGDLALMKDNDGLGSGGGLLWLIAIIILLGGGAGLGYGARGAGPDLATANQMNQGFMNQNLQQIALSSANNNYETARLVSEQTNALMQQNNTNLINAIQGFNSINISLQNLMAKMESCCCDIKTQMLQNRYEDERAKNVSLQNEISNFQQSQYILNQMGRWVAWVGNGSQAAAST